MPDGEPFKATEAKRRIREIVATGLFLVSSHALDEMAKEKPELTMVDVVNVLRGGIVGEGEWEKGSWRHHVRTPRMCFVITFSSDTELVVVTAWREKNG